jgi:hypothetical protein
MERFPDSKEVQGAALSTIFPIQQTCQSIGNLEGVYFTNLVNANALQLVFAALENHSDDYHSVSGALTVFYNLACGDNEDQRIQKVVCSFLRARQTSIPSLQEIQQNLIPTISLSRAMLSWHLLPSNPSWRPIRSHSFVFKQ